MAAAGLAKEAAAERGARMLSEVIRQVESVGVGTGSTVKLMLSKLDKDTLKILAAKKVYASSLDTLLYLESLGIKALMHVNGVIDVYFDGADEVTLNTACPMIKGRGAAMTREKILAYNSRHVVIVVDESKISKRIGEKGKPLPVEVLPQALHPFLEAMRSLGVKAEPRSNCSCRDGPAVTDNGGIVVDTWPWSKYMLDEFEGILARIPGVIGHGSFIGYVNKVIVGFSTGEAAVWKCERKIMNPSLARLNHP